MLELEWFRCSCFLFLAEEFVKLLFIRVIAQKIVELRARLHGVEYVLLCAVLADVLVHVERGGIHRAKGRERIECKRYIRAAQFVQREQGRRAKLRDVGQ